jgi:hypothetical protein
MDEQIAGQQTIETMTRPDEQLNFLDVIGTVLPALESLKETLKLKKEMLQSELHQNAEYIQAEEKKKEALLTFKAAKDTALKVTICAELAETIKVAASQLKEKKAILSDVAVGYAERTGHTTVRTHDGNVYEIVKTARLKRSR